MSFIPKTFGGLASGLFDGKKGAFSNVGNMVGGPIDGLGIGKATQRLVDNTGVNGLEAKTGLNGGTGTDLPVRRLSGRGSSSLSV